VRCFASLDCCFKATEQQRKQHKAGPHTRRSRHTCVASPIYASGYEAGRSEQEQHHAVQPRSFCRPAFSWSQAWRETQPEGAKGETVPGHEQVPGPWTAVRRPWFSPWLPAKSLLRGGGVASADVRRAMVTVATFRRCASMLRANISCSGRRLVLALRRGGWRTGACSVASAAASPPSGQVDRRQARGGQPDSSTGAPTKRQSPVVLGRQSSRVRRRCVNYSSWRRAASWHRVASARG
jgi:hypothetical protein